MYKKIIDLVLRAKIFTQNLGPVSKALLIASDGNTYATV